MIKKNWEIASLRSQWRGGWSSMRSTALYHYEPTGCGNRVWRLLRLRSQWRNGLRLCPQWRFRVFVNAEYRTSELRA